MEERTLQEFLKKLKIIEYLTVKESFSDRNVAYIVNNTEDQVYCYRTVLLSKKYVKELLDNGYENDGDKDGKTI